MFLVVGLAFIDAWSHSAKFLEAIITNVSDSPCSNDVFVIFLWEMTAFTEGVVDVGSAGLAKGTRFQLSLGPHYSSG